MRIFLCHKKLSCILSSIMCALLIKQGQCAHAEKLRVDYQEDTNRAVRTTRIISVVRTLSQGFGASRRMWGFMRAPASRPGRVFLSLRGNMERRKGRGGVTGQSPVKRGYAPPFNNRVYPQNKKDCDFAVLNLFWEQREWVTIPRPPDYESDALTS